MTQTAWAAELAAIEPEARIYKRLAQRWFRGTSIPDALAERAIVTQCNERHLFSTLFMDGQPFSEAMLRAALIDARTSLSTTQPADQEARVATHSATSVSCPTIDLLEAAPESLTQPGGARTQSSWRRCADRRTRGWPAVVVAGLTIVSIIWFLLAREGQPRCGGSPSQITDVTAAARILEPKNGTTVPQGSVIVRGTASEGPGGSHLWTLVGYQGVYYPQREVQIDGRDWVGQALLGIGPPDSGKSLDIVLVAATSAATCDMSAWLQRGQETGNYPAYIGLPTGTIELDRVTVSLN